jgi:hypothetical protein
MYPNKVMVHEYQMLDIEELLNVIEVMLLYQNLPLLTRLEIEIKRFFFNIFIFYYINILLT